MSGMRSPEFGALRRLTRVLLAGAAILGCAQQGWAEDAGTDTLEAVVVSAPHYVPTGSGFGSKLDVPIIDTPQSISVVTRDQVDLLNIQNLSQAVRYTSGVVGENYGSDERYDWMTLRGFTPIQYVDGLQAPVGSVSSIGIDLYGFDSMEILKGPASTLYGLAPPGGIVNLTSRRPSSDFSGQVLAQYGSYDDVEIAGDITGALLGDGALSGRLTALYRNRGTQTEGVNSERFYIAPALTWQVGDATSVSLLTYYQYDDIRGDGGGFLPIQGVLYPNPLGKVPTSRNIGDTKYNDYRRNQYAIGYNIKHEVTDWLSLEQNTKYFYNKYLMLDVYGAGLVDADYDGVPDDYRTVQRYNFPFAENIQSFNVDTRAKASFDTGAVSHTMLVGVDYRRYTNQADYGFAMAPSIDLFNPVHEMPITTPALSAYTRQVEKQVGFYAEDQIKYDAWILTLSGRQDWVHTTNFGAGKDDNKFTYRVGLNYHFDSGVVPYFSYSTSFQPVAGSDFSGNAFKASAGDQIEAGLKYEPSFLPSGVKALTTLAFYDLNQDNVKTDDPAHAYFSVQTGAVEVKGVEWELVTRIHDRFTVNASYSFTESEVTKSNGADLGKQLVMTPKNKISLFADYTEQTGFFAGFGAGFGLRYLSESYGDGANTFRNAPVALYDAIIHYDIDKWRLQLNASNLFDKTYISRCTSTTQCFYGLRRNVLVTLTRNF